MIEEIKTTYKDFEGAYPLWFKLGRFCISGGAGAAINIGILFTLTHVFHVWYLFSSIASFLVAFCASFTFQKFWTFRDKDTDRLHAQAGWYLAITLFNLGLNTLIVYCAVEYGGFHYIGAQILSSALIAVESYFVYRLIFKKEAPPAT